MKETDTQRNYSPPKGDSAEQIAEDAASDYTRYNSWVFKKRIDALIDSECETERKRESDLVIKELGLRFGLDLSENPTLDELELKIRRKFGPNKRSSSYHRQIYYK